MIITKNFLRHWAISATAVSLILVGILIGRTTGSQSSLANIDAAPSTAPHTVTSDPNVAMQPSEPFVVPDSFTALPGEWRSASTASGDGFAIFFAPARREVIVEKCQHPGYFDAKANQPVPDGIDFCTAILWAELLSLSETSASAVDRSGRAINLTLNLSEAGERQQLTVSFEEHTMVLVPGSKNDLFQATEMKPEIVEQKRRMFEFYQAANSSRQSAVQTTTNSAQTDPPRYVLPVQAGESTKNTATSK